MNRRTFLGRLSALAGTLAVSPPFPSARHTSARPAPDDNEAFDYVVVGAGSAGCVVASRLSAAPDVRVLLLEAGGPPDEHLARPGAWVSLLGSDVDWQHATTPQAGLLGRTIAWPRGKVLGGSSAINAMAYVRGHRRDFDAWRDGGCRGWGFDDVLPVFRRAEDNSRGPSAFRGAGGPLAVSDTTDPTGAHLAFLDAARAVGFDADPAWDFNGARQENGAGFYQKNIKDGRRHSAAAAYLEPVLSRPNLVVSPRSLTTRVALAGSRAAVVEYVRDGSRRRARASREVVLCGGVIDSPRILMLSGIGPPDELRRLGIPVVMAAPGVGGNLHDHPRVSVVHRARREVPASSVSAGLFVRSPGVAAGGAPDLHFYFGRGVDTASAVLTITTALGRPSSRGALRLASDDPSAAPLIDPRYFEHGTDLAATVAGVRLARDLARAAAFDTWRGDEVEPGATARTDAELAAFVRRAADTMFHPVGTCRMGTDDAAVVDPMLRVRGVEGLRVADASIMPAVVNAPTHAAAVMIGERAADLIRGG